MLPLTATNKSASHSTTKLFTYPFFKLTTQKHYSLQLEQFTALILIKTFVFESALMLQIWRFTTVLNSVKSNVSLFIFLSTYWMKINHMVKTEKPLTFSERPDYQLFVVWYFIKTFIVTANFEPKFLIFN